MKLCIATFLKGNIFIINEYLSTLKHIIYARIKLGRVTSIVCNRPTLECNILVLLSIL